MFASELEIRVTFRLKVMDMLKTAYACGARLLPMRTWTLPSATALNMSTAVLLTIGRGTTSRSVESPGYRLVVTKMTVVLLNI